MTAKEEFRKEAKRLLELIKQFHPNLKEASQSTYQSRILRLMGLLPDGEKNLLNSLINTEEVKKRLDEVETQTSRKDLTAMILMLNKLNGGNPALQEKLNKSYKEYFDKLQNKIMIKVSKQEKSDKEKKNWVSWSKLERLVESWRKKWSRDKTQMNMLKSVIAGLYFSTDLLPPRRGIYRTFLYIPDWDKGKKPNDMNYYWKGGFYFNDTKDGKKLVIQIKDKRAKIIGLIKRYRERYNQTKWLLVTPKHQVRMSQGYFNDILHQVTAPAGKGIGIDLIRKIYINEKVKGQSIYEQKKIAKLMGHSLSTNQLYYQKMDSEEESLEPDDVSR